jgi:hypothetical protein
MSVSSIGGVPIAAAAPARRLIPRVSDPLFQPGMAAFIANSVRARLHRPTVADVLEMIRKANQPRFDRFV